MKRFPMFIFLIIALNYSVKSQNTSNSENLVVSCKNAIVQIFTPFCTATGFYIKASNLIVTNNHVVEGNREVIIEGSEVPRQICKVIYTDTKFDLAFLEPPSNSENLPNLTLASNQVVEGDKVIAIGFPLGFEYTFTQGIVNNSRYIYNSIDYIQHDAALNPGNSGSPLINKERIVVGVNTFIIENGTRIGFALSAKYLNKALSEFQLGKGEAAVRCANCSNLVFNNVIKHKGYCPYCGSKIILPSEVEIYPPEGIELKIENILDKLGLYTPICRYGNGHWKVQQGSSKIDITYRKESGLIIFDAFLCTLPNNKIKPLYEYMLHENYNDDEINLNVYNEDIILSLLVYDRYLKEDIAIKMIKKLFEKADLYDNIFVEKYEAKWIKK